MLSKYCYIRFTHQFSNENIIATLQSQHTGEIGRDGLNVAKNVAEEFLTEEEDATNLNAQILITEGALVKDTSIRNAMSTVVHVCYS